MRLHLLALTGVLTLAAQPLAAQGRTTAGYHPAARFSAALDSVARASRGFVTVSTIATSPGGRPVQLVRLGDSDEKPALLVLANAYGPQIASSEVALRLIGDLAARRAAPGTAATLFADFTVYVVPRLNPDASEAFFAPVRAERIGNDERSDDDRDGAVNEDAPDDLNGDGLITMMRVKVDAGGEWIADAVDPSLMRRADAIKGERGQYKLYVEGRDDDGDDAFNEDGVGGTDVSMNFGNNFSWFAAGSGQHQFSANEARAIADLMVARANIAAVYVLGMQDNLIKPWEGRTVPGIGGSPQGTSAGGPFTAILPADAPWFAEVGKKAPRPVAGQDPVSASEAGDPLSWAYFHMGRFAFGSRVWWPGKAAADTAAARQAPTPDPVANDRNDYRWLKANNPAGFVEWAQVAGFTIDGKPVEVGGFAPGARLNPSAAATLDSLGKQQADWVLALTAMLPKTSLVGPATVTAVGPRIWRVTAEITNSSFLPTNAAIGVRSRLPRRVMVELKLGANQVLTSGRKVQYVDALRGSGAMQRFEWLVVGDAGSTVTLSVGAPNAGTVNESITLRAR
jgi:Zinc carboxypeptidase